MAVLATWPAGAFGQATISTYPSWDGTSDINPWGSPGSVNTTYGQTFRTPDAVNVVLTSMQFTIRNSSGSAQPFRAYVYAWADDTLNGGGRLVGTTLFAGGSPSGTVAVAPGFVNYSVGTGTLQLTPNTQYVAFYTTAGQGGLDASSDWAAMSTSVNGGNAYSGGKFVGDSGNSIGSLETRLWAEVTSTYDLAFQLTFTPVPEPSGLLAVAAVTAAVAARRRRRAGTPPC